MAKRFITCLMALSLMMGVVGLVGCGEGEKTSGLTAEEIAAKKAKQDASTQNATTKP